MNFDQLYHRALLHEKSQKYKTVGKSIGIFPGAFKPPHKGHYMTAEKAMSDNDIVVVFVSGQDRGDSGEKISADQSMAIWKLYKDYMLSTTPYKSDMVLAKVDNWRSPDTNRVKTVLGATYDILSILNDMYSGSNFNEVHPQARRVAERILSDSNPDLGFDVSLYCGDDDMCRYGSINQPAYVGHRVKRVAPAPVVRAASASNIRPHVRTFRKHRTDSNHDVVQDILSQAHLSKDYETIMDNLPGDEELKNNVLRILVK